MELTKKINQQINKRFPELVGYYYSDIWDMTKHVKFKTMTPEMQDYLSSRIHIIDFYKCKNINLKEELKYHLYRFIEIRDKELTNMPMRIPALYTFMEYANVELMYVNSILDLKYTNLIKSYTNFLKREGYNVSNIVQKKITEDMTLKEYKYPSKYEHEFKIFYESIQEYYNPENYLPELKKDKWDVRNLPFKVEVSKSRPRYTISFEKIYQEKIRNITKRYVEYRLKSGIKYGTCIADLKGINLLSEFLHKHYSKIQSLDELDRDIMEGFIGFVKTSDKLAGRTKSARIGTVNTFFNICQLNNWENAPEKTLIINSDYKYKIKTMPKYFTEEELNNLNEHIDKLPIQIARMLFVIENVGMRVGELCSLRVDCLSMNDKGEYSISYMQEKTETYNIVPINETVAKCIQEAEKESREEFGEDIKFIFSKNRKEPISLDTFSYQLNKLVYFNEIKDRNGNLLRIHTHTFRGTVATKYANLGINQDIIRRMLGQKTTGTLKHYVKIHNATLLESMEDIIDVQNHMIKNIGKEINPISKPATNCLVSLPNGSCNKPISEGKCTKANACYTCRMFKASPEYLDMYKNQLNEAENNVKIAKLNGWKRIEENNIDLVNALNNIISTVLKESKK